MYKAGFKIHYEIRTQLKKQSYRRPFFLEAVPLATNKKPFAWGPSSFEVWSGLMKRGSLHLSVNMTNTHVGRGEQLDLSLACRNHSHFDIERVEIQLLEQMHWKTDSQCRPLVTILDADLPGLHKRKAIEAQVVYKERFTNVSPDRQGISNNLRSGENMLRLTVPEHSLDSYEGELVKISHFLEVKLVTKVHSYSARIPIRIGSSPLNERASDSCSTLLSNSLQVDAIAVAWNPNSNYSDLHIPVVEAIPAVEAYEVNAEGLKL